MDNLTPPPIVRLMLIPQTPVKVGDVIGWANYADQHGTELFLPDGSLQWVPKGTI